jgi:alkylation response protein AidB-like acyl-CoA dehydrogenase
VPGTGVHVSTDVKDWRAVGSQEWLGVARELGPVFGARAATHDAADSFAVDNYQDLKQRRVLSAAVPGELGGGGATHAQLCEMLREFARHCGSTALALSMHTHVVVTLVWRYRQGLPAEALLRRIAAEQLSLVGTGSSDWLESTGGAERVDGGYRVTARKTFCSGSPAGTLLLTTAPYDDPADGPTVLHFAVPMASDGVSVLDNWRTMGMRASGSNDVVLENVFVPEEAVSLRRPRGQWHPFFNVAFPIAWPIIMSVYLGVAEAARDLAMQQVQRKRDDSDTWYLMGELDNALVTAQMAVQSMVDLCANLAFVPEIGTVNAAVIRKTIAAQAILSAVEKSGEMVGGGSFFRTIELERMLRDVHATQFHPLQPKRQHRFSGRLALGLDPVG